MNIYRITAQHAFTSQRTVRRIQAYSPKDALRIVGAELDANNLYVVSIVTE